MSNSLRHRQWLARDQPQTLQIATILLYWNAVLGFLFFFLLHGAANRLFSLLLVLADALGGYGVANARRWGYTTAVVAAALPFIGLFVGRSILAGGLINLIFEIALVALLLHPMSRAYTKIWFR